MKRISQDIVEEVKQVPAKESVVNYNIKELKEERQRLQDRLAEIKVVLDEEKKLPEFVEPIEEVKEVELVEVVDGNVGYGTTNPEVKLDIPQ